MTAQIIPALPYNIVDGQIVDANPVMANFNAIVTAVNANAQPSTSPLFVLPTQAPFNADPTGVIDATAAFVAWWAAINGGYGFIPPGTFLVPAGLKIAGHSATTVRAAANAQFNCTAMVSGYALNFDSCQFCDIELGYINCGYSGVLMTNVGGKHDYNRFKFNRVQGTGRQGAKPADPLANRIGVYFVGGLPGTENYFNVIDNAAKIDGFDTPIAFSANDNANMNNVQAPSLSGYWFGVYHNASDNQVRDAQWWGTAGTDGSHLAECVRYGDGVGIAFQNVTSGVAEPGGSNCTSGLAQANSARNLTDIRDNLDTFYTDNGVNNEWRLSMSGSVAGGQSPVILPTGTFTPTITDGTHNMTASVAQGNYWRTRTPQGDRIDWVAEITTTAKGSISGSLFIGGLPVASNAGGNRVSSVSIGGYTGVTFGGGYTQLTGLQNPGATLVHLEQCGSGVGIADITDANVAAATTIVASGSYFV